MILLVRQVPETIIEAMEGIASLGLLFLWYVQYYGKYLDRYLGLLGTVVDGTLVLPRYLGWSQHSSKQSNKQGLAPAWQTFAPARPFLFPEVSLSRERGLALLAHSLTHPSTRPLVHSTHLTPHLAKILASPSEFLILASHQLTSHTNLPRYFAPRPTPGTQIGHSNKLRRCFYGNATPDGLCVQTHGTCNMNIDQIV